MRRVVADEPQLVAELSWTAIAHPIIAFVVIVAMLWMQAIIEELAWRSYVLPRLIVRSGRGRVARTARSGGCAARRVRGERRQRGKLARVHRDLRPARRAARLVATRRAQHLRERCFEHATLTVCAGLPTFLVGDTSRFSAASHRVGWRCSPSSAASWRIGRGAERSQCRGDGYRST